MTAPGVGRRNGWVRISLGSVAEVKPRTVGLDKALCWAQGGCWALKGNTAWRTGTWNHEMLFTYAEPWPELSQHWAGHKPQMIFRFHSRVPLMEQVGENPSEPTRQNILE